MVGPGSQKNKAHKAGRRAGRSAREKHRDKKDMVGGGRVGIKSTGHTVQGRADRLNAAKQIRENKRSELLEARRAHGAPCLVTLLPLSDHVDIHRVWSGLLKACSHGDSTTATNNEGSMDIDEKANGVLDASTPLEPITMSFPDRKRVKFTFLPPPTDRSNPLDVVEIGRVAEVVLCILPGNSSEYPIDKYGENALWILRSIGLPTTVALVQTSGVSQNNLKERSAAKKRATEAFVSEIPGDHRIMSADSAADFKQIVRHLADSPHAAPVWRRQRPQLAVQDADLDQASGSLVLSGYIRCQALAASQALHIPTAGDFQIERILGPPEPEPANNNVPRRGLSRPQIVTNMEDIGGPSTATTATATITTTTLASQFPVVLARVDPTKREQLTRENEVDLLDAEQTWPTEEELRDAEHARMVNNKNSSKIRKLPKGTSDYQAAWILDDVDYGDDDEDEEDESLPDLELNTEMDNDGDRDGELPDWQKLDGGATEMDMLEYQDNDEEDGEENAIAAKMKHRKMAEEDELNYPDEVETPIDIPARQRFARYRGLKSFRTSPWDPKEDLPRDYARVFAFENFKRTLKRARESVASAATAQIEEKTAVAVGTYVSVVVANVPEDAAKRVVERVKAFQTGSAQMLTVWGLLQHECKLSVVNFSVKKMSTYEQPIPNKEELLFVTGLRSFQAKPIFSTDEHGADKHKMERFLLAGRPSVATVYAPISYPPLPLLAFKKMPDDTLELVATGALKDCNPDRVILKKIVLSGYPVKAHKSKAVVRWMFHTPEDVKWFRPVELWTRQGRRGRIREPLGTHGTMKCIFDGPIGQQDGVCMSLYKRTYPKWPTDLTFAL